MIKSLSFFEFSSGGYFATQYTVKYENGILETLVQEGHFPSLEKEDKKKEQLSANQFVIEAIEALNKAAFLSWDREYYQPICDGVQWELNIRYNGNLKKKVHGSNDYPEGYECVSDLIEKL